MDLTNDERRIAIEVIATLVRIKSSMAEMILKPAGVSSCVYKPLLYKRDEETGCTLSKRQIAPIMVYTLSQNENGVRSIRAINEIAANWTSFELAEDEAAARLLVEKARDLIKTIRKLEKTESAKTILDREEEVARIEQGRASLITRQLDLFAMMYDSLGTSSTYRKGIVLQDLLHGLFSFFQIQILTCFSMDDSGKLISGEFRLEKKYYMLECRWAEPLSSMTDLSELNRMVSTTKHLKAGICFSIEGWSEDFEYIVRSSPNLRISFISGKDLKQIASGKIDFFDYMLVKTAKLECSADPFFSVTDYLDEL